jgi:hypothetical protein
MMKGAGDQKGTGSGANYQPQQQRRKRPNSLLDASSASLLADADFGGAAAAAAAAANDPLNASALGLDTSALSPPSGQPLLPVLDVQPCVACVRFVTEALTHCGALIPLQDRYVCARCCARCGARTADVTPLIHTL